MSRKPSKSSKTAPIAGRSRKGRPMVLFQLPHHASLETTNGVVAAAREFGWQLLTNWQLHLAGPDGHLPSSVALQGVLDGSIAWESEFDDLRANGVPVVRLGLLPHPEDHLLPAVLPDHAAAGRLAAKHLAERGFKELGFVGYRRREVARILWESFNAQAKELGFTCHLLELGGESQPESTRQSLQQSAQREWLESMPKPFGVFTYANIRASQICVSCLTSGISIPEEVGILGYGSSLYFCEDSLVEISSIDPNMETYGHEAARLLHRLMNGEAAPTKPIMISPKGVVQRHSTDLLAIPHPQVAEALRYIHDHFDEPLSVPEIARQIGMSRSGLDRAFRRHLGRPVNAEVLRKRLERSAELLRSTDLTVERIARSTGFGTEPYFYKTFKKAYGLTPNQYRSQSR